MKKMTKLLLILAVASLLLLPALTLGEAEPLACTFKLDKTTVKMEETIQATWHITGGTPPYTISACYVDESPVTMLGNVAKWTPSPADDTPGSQRFYLTIIDDAGAQHSFHSDAFTLVDEKPLMFSIGDFPTELQIGQRLNIPWSITGGEPPYNLVRTYMASNDFRRNLKHEMGADNSSTDVFVSSYKITSPPEQHYLEYRIEDAKGRTAYARTPEFIVVDNNPITWTLLDANTPQTISVGEEVNATFSLSGGTPPYVVSGNFFCPLDHAYLSFFGSVDNTSTEPDTPIILKGVPGSRNIGTDWCCGVWVRDAAGRHQGFETQKLFDVTVADPLVVDAITLDKVRVAVGETVTATLTISGGTQPYTIKHLISDPAYIVEENTVTFTPTENMVGNTGEFRLEVIDSQEQIVSVKSEPFAVVRKVLPVDCTITLDTYQARFGDTINASWVIDGPAPDRVDAYFANDSAENVQGNSATFHMNSRHIAHTFAPEESLTLELTYGEDVYVFKSKPVKLLWTPSEPMTLSVTVAPEEVILGESILITAKAEGGVEPYTYCYYAGTGGEGGAEICGGEGRSADGRFVFTPPYATWWTIVIDVVDSEGRTLTKWLDARAVKAEASNSLSCNIVLNKSCLSPGETLAAYWTIAGGTPPYTITNLLWEYASAEDGYAHNYFSKVATDEGSKADFTVPEGFCFGNLHITIKDNEGKTAGFTSPQFNSLTYGQEWAFSNKVVLSADRVDIGQPITATCTPTAGSWISDITYHYTWVVVDADGRETYYPDEAAAADKTTSAFTPQAGVKGYVMVQTNYMIAQEDAKQTVVVSTPFAIGKEPLPPERPGDANGDNTVDILDLVAIIDHIVSGTSCQSMANADANGDGTVDILDLVWIIDRIVGG